MKPLSGSVKETQEDAFWVIPLLHFGDGDSVVADGRLGDIQRALHPAQ